MSFAGATSFASAPNFMQRKLLGVAGTASMPNIRQYVAVLDAGNRQMAGYAAGAMPRIASSGIAVLGPSLLADIESRAFNVDSMAQHGAAQGQMWSGWADRAYDQSAGGVFTIPDGVSGAPGTKGSGAYGLQQGFADLLLRMIADARAAGHTVRVGEGWRSYEGQVAAKRKWTAKGKPHMAATPGKSRHGWGLAADLEYGTAEARKWVHANAHRYGLRFPMSYEPWHIEPANVRRSAGGGYTVPGVKRPATPAPRSASAPTAPAPRTTPSRNVMR